MGIFYQEKAFHAGKKIRKNDFAPSEKYACYAPEQGVSSVPALMAKIVGDKSRHCFSRCLRDKQTRKLAV